MNGRDDHEQIHASRKAVCPCKLLLSSHRGSGCFEMRHAKQKGQEENQDPALKYTVQLIAQIHWPCSYRLWQDERKLGFLEPKSPGLLALLGWLGHFREGSEGRRGTSFYPRTSPDTVMLGKDIEESDPRDCLLSNVLSYLLTEPEADFTRPGPLL